MFLTQQPFEEHQTERDVQLKQSEIRSTITIKNINRVNYNILILKFFSKYRITCRYITYHVKKNSFSQVLMNNKNPNKHEQ